jgi:hypothetical protein
MKAHRLFFKRELEQLAGLRQGMSRDNIEEFPKFRRQLDDDFREIQRIQKNYDRGKLWDVEEHMRDLSQRAIEAVEHYHESQNL